MTINLDERQIFKSIIESLLFVADEPLLSKRLAEITELDKETVESLLEELRETYISENRGFQLRKIAEGWRLYSHPGNAAYVGALITVKENKRLSQAALETLSIIAYKQPVTRTGVSDIRGVNSDAVMLNLAEKGLIKESGHEETPGRPILYKTTDKFLELAGLSSLKDLPKIEEFEPDEETKESIIKSISF